jgi:hypothetical protein
VQSSDNFKCALVTSGRFFKKQDETIMVCYVTVSHHGLRKRRKA